MLRTAMLFLALVGSAGAHAQVHKCVDSQGRISYTQNPCPANARTGSVSRRIDPPSYSPPAAASAAKGDAGKSGAAKSAEPRSPAELERAFRQRQQAQAKAVKEAEEKASQAKVKEANCRSAKERLAQYEIGGRISRVDAQGGRYYLDDAEIERQKARARAEMADSCG